LDIGKNVFKNALAKRTRQIGLWCSLPGTTAAEIAAGGGYDWLLFDTEHSPADPITVLPQLQVAAAYPLASPVVRPASNDPVLIKRLLDCGAQSLLVPYVQNAEEAALAVSYSRYPPTGIRGVSGTTRASRYGRIDGYATRAAGEICVIVQVETREALTHIEQIASVDGVDGIFIGPADLAASLGFPGQPGHPDVVDAVEKSLARIIAANKPAGILTPDKEFARRCLHLGATFVAVGVDAAILTKGIDLLRDDFTV